MPDAKILVIDDESSMRTMLAVELEKAGYAVFKADDGEVGLQVVRAAKPDLIICDVLMPNMDGNQFFKKLREREYSRDIPVIIMSTRGQMKDYFMMLDADDFIAKPFKADDILKRIDRVLKKRGQKHVPQAPGQAEGEAGPPEAPVARKKVLLLDPRAEEFEKSARIFRENSFDVKTTKTVKECLDTAMTYKPDVIGIRYLTDGAGRDKTFATIKEVPHVRTIPFLVYGDDIEDATKDSILEEGVEFFVNGETDQKILQALKRMVG